MLVGMGMPAVNEEDLQFARQIGVTHLITRPDFRVDRDGYYTFESLVQLRQRVEATGLAVAALHDVPPEWNDKIRLGQSGRDEQLENYRRTLENMGRAGLPILGYSFHASRVWRTSRHAPGRGGIACTAYDHALMQNAPGAEQLELDDAQRWESYEYFIKAVMPTAESAGVKMALHPDDPPISPVAGAAYIFRDVPAFEKALSLAPSPFNGLLFCQGCYAEMLGQGVFDAIRHFGGMGKVFYVHFRNIVGVLPKFREALMDEGDIDMVKAMTTWLDTGFGGPMMPDHHPHMVGDTPYGHRSRAYAIGHMRALMLAAGVTLQ